MDSYAIKKYFCQLVRDDESMSVGVAAIRTLMKIIEEYKYETLQDLDGKLKEAITLMKNCNYPVTAINSGCEIFLRFITLCWLDDVSIEECKKTLIERGLIYFKSLDESRAKIINSVIEADLIENNVKILTHSRSRAVLQLLITAAEKGRKFEVFVTNSQPDNSGEVLHKELKKAGITSTLIMDAAIGFIMEKVDFVLVGAEGVMENGGIINKIGTYAIAVCAAELNRRFFVLAESFKFSTLRLLNQSEIPEEYKFTSETMEKGDLKNAHPLVDYTPPRYINYLFTDVGILAPPHVADIINDLYV